jgi:hypothetical protein
MTELAILIPVLERPHRVLPTIESIEATVPEARVVFLSDSGDKAEQNVINGIRSIRKGMWIELVIVDGNYAHKINIGVDHTEEPLMLFAADDLLYHDGWFEAAKAKLGEGVGVVATNDLCNKRCMAGNLATHPLVTREYAELGKIDDADKALHEGYKHEYVDQEFSETAQFRGAFAFAEDAIVEHLHPDVGKAPLDRLYADQMKRMRQGRRVFARRRHLWKKPRRERV